MMEAVATVDETTLARAIPTADALMGAAIGIAVLTRAMEDHCGAPRGADEEFLRAMATDEGFKQRQPMAMQFIHEVLALLETGPVAPSKPNLVVIEGGAAYAPAEKE